MDMDHILFRYEVDFGFYFPPETNLMKSEIKYNWTLVNKKIKKLDFKLVYEYSYSKFFIGQIIFHSKFMLKVNTRQNKICDFKHSYCYY